MRIPARSLVLLVGVALASCIPAGRPERGRQAGRPSPGDTAVCLSDLSAAAVRFRALPNREMGPGCSQYATVQLTDLGMPITGLGAIRCGAARALTAWLREDVDPAAERAFGSGVARVETAGSYACRNVVGTSTGGERRSGHAIANAVDVTGFRLRDGRRVTVLIGWNGANEDERDFLREARRGACRKFGTVLSPDYNAAHADHLHLEADRAGLCR